MSERNGSHSFLVVVFIFRDFKLLESREWREELYIPEKGYALLFIYKERCDMNLPRDLDYSIHNINLQKGIQTPHSRL